MLSVGDRVEGRYGDGPDWFAGTIQSKVGPGVFSVAYDDGDFEAEVPERRIRVPSKLFSSVPRPFSQTLSVGTAVEARFGGGEHWFSGRITGVAPDSRSYAIAYDDGDSEGAVPISFARPLEVVSMPSAQALHRNGSKIEARFGGGAEWYAGKVKSFDPQLNTYAVDYDDGDFEPTVPAAFLRHAPSYPMQPPPSHNPPPASAPPVPTEISKTSVSSLKSKLGGGGGWGALKNAAGLNNNNNGGSTPAVAAAASAFGKGGGAPKLSVAERLARAAEKAKAEKAFQVAAPPVKTAPKQWVPKKDSSSSSSMVSPPSSSSARRPSLVPAGPVIVPTRDDEANEEEEEEKNADSGSAATADGQGGEEPTASKEGGSATAANKPSKMAGLWKKAGNATQAANRFSGGGAFGVQLKSAPQPPPPKQDDEEDFPPVAQPSKPTEKQTKKSSGEGGEEAVRNFDLPPELEGVFSEKEVNSFRELFLLYDTDESGAVDREELSAIMTQLGDAPDPEKLNALINEVDEDGDCEIDFQEFCQIMHKHRDGAFGQMVAAADKKLNPTGVFREYAIPAVERLASAVAQLQGFASDPSTSLSPQSFDPLDEMLRLVPICWQRSEKLISLGQIYRAPSEGAQCHRARSMALTDDSIKLAAAKTPATGAAANHCKALAELLFGLKWLAIDFRVKFNEALAGIAKNNVSDRYPQGMGTFVPPGSHKSSSRGSPTGSMDDSVHSVSSSSSAVTSPTSGGSSKVYDAGPSGSGAASHLLDNVTESLMFWTSKIRSPVVLDPNTEAGKLDLLNREYAAALSMLLGGLRDYVAAHHPDGLKWRYDKAMTDEETAALSPKPAPKIRSLKLGLGMKGLGKAVVAANRLGSGHGGAFGVRLKKTETNTKTFHQHGDDDGDASNVVMAGVKRLGGTFFRQALPEDVVVTLEREGRTELSNLLWPACDNFTKRRVPQKRASSAMNPNQLLSKVSFWDAKLAEKSKEKSDYEASTHYMDENKSHWSPVKNNATNAGAPPSMERSMTTRMDVPTARHLLLHACNDISRMREAMEVIKAERATVAESLDGGVADASTGRNQDTRLQWQGMVKGSAFQQAVHAHNEKLQQEAHIASSLKAHGKSHAVTMKAWASSKLGDPSSSLNHAYNRPPSVQPPSPPYEGLQHHQNQKQNAMSPPPPVHLPTRTPLARTPSYRGGEEMQSRMSAMMQGALVSETKPAQRRGSNRDERKGQGPGQQAALYREGSRVSAPYGGPGGERYIGRVIGVQPDGSSGWRYALLYDDGDTEEGIAETLIQPAPELIVKVGESVNARFGGGLHYFAATIARITPRGMDLNYADGDFESDVQVSMLAPGAAPASDLLMVGTHVEARYGGGDEWFGAIIAGASGNGYDLNYDDGDFELAVPREWIR